MDKGDFWLNMLGFGITTTIGYMCGKKEGRESLEKEMKDEKILELKRQIEELKLLSKKE